MQIDTLPTFRVQIFMAGDMQYACQILRREVYPPNKGLCVTVEPTKFIYTGGEESGFVIGLVNYPRFPSSPEDLRARAVGIARMLIVQLCQRSALVVDLEQTAWVHREI